MGVIGFHTGESGGSPRPTRHGGVAGIGNAEPRHLQGPCTLARPELESAIAQMVEHRDAPHAHRMVDDGIEVEDPRSDVDPRVNAAT